MQGPQRMSRSNNRLLLSRTLQSRGPLSLPKFNLQVLPRLIMTFSFSRPRASLELSLWPNSWTFPPSTDWATCSQMAPTVCFSTTAPKSFFIPTYSTLIMSRGPSSSLFSTRQGKHWTVWQIKSLSSTFSTTRSPSTRKLCCFSISRANWMGTRNSSQSNSTSPRSKHQRDSKIWTWTLLSTSRNGNVQRKLFYFATQTKWFRSCSKTLQNWYCAREVGSSPLLIQSKKWRPCLLVYRTTQISK